MLGHTHWVVVQWGHDALACGVLACGASQLEWMWGGMHGWYALSCAAQGSEEGAMEGRNQRTHLRLLTSTLPCPVVSAPHLPSGVRFEASPSSSMIAGRGMTTVLFSCVSGVKDKKEGGVPHCPTFLICTNRGRGVGGQGMVHASRQQARLCGVMCTGGCGWVMHT